MGVNLRMFGVAYKKRAIAISKSWEFFFIIPKKTDQRAGLQKL